MKHIWLVESRKRQYHGLVFRGNTMLSVALEYALASQVRLIAKLERTSLSTQYERSK